MNQRANRLAIIGGGAAGLTAAIAAGEQARSHGVPLDIVVFERDEKPAAQIATALGTDSEN